MMPPWVALVLSGNLVVIPEEFANMKEEVPPALLDSHIKHVEEATKDGQKVEADYGIEKSGIAGTESDHEDESGQSQSLSFPKGIDITHFVKPREGAEPVLFLSLLHVSL